MSANTQINRKPSQNTGIENPITEKPMTTRSIHVFAFHAANTPIGIASEIATISVRTVNAMVGSSRPRMMPVTGLPERIDVPRSPLASIPIHETNCSLTGLSRPSRFLIFSMSSAVSSSPASSAAGSPGVIWSRPKVNKATTSMVGKTRSSRRPMYARMSCCQPEKWALQYRIPTVVSP